MEVLQKTMPADKVQLGFPVYAVAYSPATSTIYVAGGGGPGKSGVRNAIVTLLVLVYTTNIIYFR